MSLVLDMISNRAATLVDRESWLPKLTEEDRAELLRITEEEYRRTGYWDLICRLKRYRCGFRCEGCGATETPLWVRAKPGIARGCEDLDPCLVVAECDRCRPSSRGAWRS